MHLKAHVVSLACFILAVACLLQFSLKSQFRARISEGLLYIEMILCFLRPTCTVFVNRFVLEFAMLSVLHKTLLYKKLSFAWAKGLGMVTWPVSAIPGYSSTWSHWREITYLMNNSWAHNSATTFLTYSALTLRSLSL